MILLGLIVIFVFFNSFILTPESSPLLRGSEKASLIAQINPFYSIPEISKDGIYVYGPSVSFSCNGWSHSDITSIVSSDEDRLTKSKVVFIPLMCSNDLAKDITNVLEEMDSDTFTVGQTIVWILPGRDPSEVILLERQKIRIGIHLIHPIDFLPLDPFKGIEPKSTVLWKQGMERELIATSQFCRHGAFNLDFFIFIQSGCIPVVDNEAVLPLSKAIMWDTSVVQVDPHDDVDDIVANINEHAINFKIRVATTIRNHLVSLSRETAFLYSIMLK